jgi:hypothetical protein
MVESKEISYSLSPVVASSLVRCNGLWLLKGHLHGLLQSLKHFTQKAISKISAADYYQ